MFGVTGKGHGSVRMWFASSWHGVIDFIAFGAAVYREAAKNFFIGEK